MDVAFASTIFAGRERQDRDSSIEGLAAATGSDVTPDEAQRLVEAGVAVLVDIRTAEERKALGFAPGSIHVAWKLGAARLPNPRFLREFASRVPADRIPLLICATARRTGEAAPLVRGAGFADARNVLEGYDGSPEGPGWIARGLPHSLANAAR